MSNWKEKKKLIFSHLHEIIEQRIEIAVKAIQSAKESRDNDTKSSMGDKYETGRAMIQMELEKYELQLSKNLKLKNELSQVNLKKEYNKVEYGSLIITNQGNYFISFGQGKIKINNTAYYCISLASPIGMLLQGSKEGDKVLFQEKKITIKTIV